MFGLSIIIVNYKSANHILNCLKSVYQFDFSFNYEIIIVDNHSEDDSRNIIKKNYPEIIWHDIGYNAGFARANNYAIKLSKYDHILLLNPDTIILENSLNKCFEKFSISDYAACGLQLLNPDRSFQISGSNFFVGGLNYLLPVPYLGSFFKWVALKISIKPTHVKQVSPINIVEWINGAFLMTKKSVIKKAGYLDEDFFLYAEEIEWCSRLCNYGKLVLYGNLHVMHLIGGSSKPSNKNIDNVYLNLYDFKGLQLLVSNLLLIIKKYGLFWFFLHLFCHTTGMILNLVLLPFEILYFRKPYHELINNAFGYAKNVFKIWQLLPRYLSKSPYFFKMF